jgi:hypothetical protein
VSWETLNDTTPKARKRYQCSGCCEVIEVGEKHRYQVGKLDGDFQANRWHPECFWFASDSCEIEEGITPGNFSRKEALAAQQQEPTP